MSKNAALLPTRLSTTADSEFLRLLYSAGLHKRKDPAYLLSTIPANAAIFISFLCNSGSGFSSR